MNKQELLEKLKKLELNGSGYCILSGGSLVIHGIKEQTGDLDLYVTQEQFLDLKNRYEMIDKSNKEIYQYPLYNIPEYDVDIYLMKDVKIDYVDDIPVQSLEQIAEFKKRRLELGVKPEKDREDLEKILNYMKQRKLKEEIER